MKKNERTHLLKGTKPLLSNLEFIIQSYLELESIYFYSNKSWLSHDHTKGPDLFTAHDLAFGSLQHSIAFSEAHNRLWIFGLVLQILKLFKGNCMCILQQFSRRSRSRRKFSFQERYSTLLWSQSSLRN